VIDVSKELVAFETSVTGSRHCGTTRLLEIVRYVTLKRDLFHKTYVGGIVTNMYHIFILGLPEERIH
jgi:hypothetical protein